MIEQGALYYAPPFGLASPHLSDTHLPVWALLAWMIVLGTIVPFMLIVGLGVAYFLWTQL